MSGHISMEAVYIALNEMKSRAAKLHRERQRLQEDIESLEYDIYVKEQTISDARDKWLVGGCV